MAGVCGTAAAGGLGLLGGLGTVGNRRRCSVQLAVLWDKAASSLLFRHSQPEMQLAQLLRRHFGRGAHEPANWLFLSGALIF